jgi:hypothetical protein
MTGRPGDHPQARWVPNRTVGLSRRWLDGISIIGSLKGQGECLQKALFRATICGVFFLDSRTSELHLPHRRSEQQRGRTAGQMPGGA